MKIVKCRVLACGDGVINQEFIPKKHYGIDLVAAIAGKRAVDDIVAHSDGEVIEVMDGIGDKDDKHIYGNYVKIKHSDIYSTYYAHMKKGSVAVKKGDKVKKGQIIGRMGNTGTTKSTGAHLHFVVYKEKERIDPMPFLDNDLPLVPEDILYTVKKGDSYWAIAKMAKKTYGATIGYKDLQKYKDNPEHIHPGDIVKIPVGIIPAVAIKEGTLVKVKNGATNVAGVVLASWVFTDTFVVLADPSKENKVKIGKIDALGVKHKTATMWLKDLEVVK